MLKKGLFASTIILAGATAALASENPYIALQQRGLVVDSMIPQKITLSDHTIKTVRLMSIALSPSVAKTLSDRIESVLRHPYQPGSMVSEDLPVKNYIGMSGEAVLDQGQWGTCATFSTTAAVNALLGLTDDSMVSQLCNLEVGRTLNNGGDGGWEGSFGYVVLGQITQDGYVNMSYQKATGCGGLTAYPTNSFDSGVAMTVADFTANSAMTFTNKDWTPIVAFDGHFSPIDSTKAAAALTSVKNAINQGYRVVFGTLIDPNVGEVGAAGTYKAITDDTWVMTTQMQQDISSDAAMEGHEIIIDGYDDKACATYTEGTDTKAKKQCGLLRIRNSWGSGAGDQGDYYMSYDHFKGMVIEAYAIGQDVKDNFKPS